LGGGELVDCHHVEFVINDEGDRTGRKNEPAIGCDGIS
jgi:hypothetical protein